MNSFYKFLGEKLRAHRKTKKMTIKEIAVEINKSIATVSKYEKGEIAIDVETLYKWCSFMNIDVQSLLPQNDASPVNENITRYKKHLFDKLYVYNYRSKGKKFYNAVIECDNKTCNVTMYLFAKDINNYFDCEFLYKGYVIYSDTHTSFVVRNINPPFDLLVLSIPTMSAKNEYIIGLLTSTTTHYENIALKTLVSESPITDTDLLEKKLKLTTEELKLIKATNFFIIE